MPPSDTRSRCARAVVDRLGSESIRYAVFKSPVPMEAVLGRDLDLLVHWEDRDRAVALARDVMAAWWEACTVCDRHHEGASVYGFTVLECSIIQLEIHFTRVRWLGLELVDDRQAVEWRRADGSGAVRVIDDLLAWTIAAAHYFLVGKSVKSLSERAYDSIRWCHDRGPDQVEKAIMALHPGARPAARAMFDAMACSTDHRGRVLLGLVRSRFILCHGLRKPGTTLARLAKYAALRTKRRATGEMCGFAVVVDGDRSAVERWRGILATISTEVLSDDHTTRMRKKDVRRTLAGAGGVVASNSQALPRAIPWTRVFGDPDGDSVRALVADFVRRHESNGRSAVQDQ